jgi:hypothetical protein
MNLGSYYKAGHAQTAGNISPFGLIQEGPLACSTGAQDLRGLKVSQLEQKAVGFG